MGLCNNLMSEWFPSCSHNPSVWQSDTTCAHHGKVSSSFRCVDCFFYTKCFGKLGGRIWNIFLFMGATQSRGSTRNVLYSRRGALSSHGNLKNASMAFYPCVSITIISKNIYIIWKWQRPGSLASVSSQLSFTWSCEINYMQQIPTADKFFSICFPIRAKKNVELLSCNNCTSKS